MATFVIDPESTRIIDTPGVAYNCDVSDIDVIHLSIHNLRLVLKFPTRKVWNGNYQPRATVPANFEVYDIESIEVNERGRLVVRTPSLLGLSIDVRAKHDESAVRKAVNVISGKG